MKGEGGTDVWGLGAWGGKAKSLSSACSEFLTDTRPEVVSGGTGEGAEKVGMPEEEIVPSGALEGCQTPACCLARIRLLFHFFLKLLNIFKHN